MLLSTRIPKESAGVLSTPQSANKPLLFEAQVIAKIPTFNHSMARIHEAYMERVKPPSKEERKLARQNQQRLDRDEFNRKRLLEEMSASSVPSPPISREEATTTDSSTTVASATSVNAGSSQPQQRRKIAVLVR